MLKNRLQKLFGKSPKKSIKNFEFFKGESGHLIRRETLKKYLVWNSQISYQQAERVVADLETLGLLEVVSAEQIMAREGA